jgi:hypothetical protein
MKGQLKKKEEKQKKALKEVEIFVHVCSTM